MRLGPKAKSLLRQAHFCLAAIASLPLLVLSVTGALLVFPEETRALVAVDDLSVKPGERFLPPSELLAAAKPHLADGETIRRFQYPRSNDEPLLVEGKENLLLIDPYDGRLLAKSPARSDFIKLVTSIHVSLLAGETGTWITSLSSAALVLLCLSGVWLWFPVGRLKSDYFRVVFSKGWKRANWDLHRTTGLYSAIVLLAIAGTGAAIAFWEATSAVVYLATWSERMPPGSALEVNASGKETREFLDPDSILQIALAEFPKHEPHRFYFPAAPEKPYRVFLDPPGEHEFRANEVRLEIDPYDGSILRDESPRTMSRGDVAMRWILPLHFGTFGGTFTKFLWLVASLSPILLAVTGTTIWLHRQAKQRRAARSKREPRGGEASASRSANTKSPATAGEDGVRSERKEQPDADLAEF